MPLAESNIAQSIVPGVGGRGVVRFMNNGVRRDYVIVDPAGSAFLPAAIGSAMAGDGGSKAIYDRLKTDPAITTAFNANNLRPATRPNGTGIINETQAFFNDNATLQANNYFIIHAVGPRYAVGGNKVQFEQDLRTTLTSTLRAWNGNPQIRDKNLAISLISSKIFGGNALGSEYYDIFVRSLNGAITDAGIDAAALGRINIAPGDQDEEHEVRVALARSLGKAPPPRPAAPKPAPPPKPGPAPKSTPTGKPNVAGLHPNFATAKCFEALSDHTPVSFAVAGHNIMTLNLLKKCTSETTVDGAGSRVGCNNPRNTEETDAQYIARFRQQIRLLSQAVKSHDIVTLQEADILHDNPALLTELLTALGPDYSITSETGEDYKAPPAAIAKHPHPKGLATIYNRRKYQPTRTILAASLTKGPAGAQYDQHHAMITTFTPVGGGEPIEVGNMHLSFREASAQIAELDALATTNLRIIAGDTNSPIADNPLCFGINAPTCYDSIDKQCGSKMAVDGGNQTIFHGTTTAEIAAGKQKAYDVALVKAGVRDVEVNVNAGRYIAVESDGKTVKHVTYAAGPKITVTRGTSYNRSIARPAPAARSVISLADKSRAEEAVANVLDPTKPKNPDVERAFEESIASQKDNSQPNKAYRGIGVSGRVKKLPSGQVVIVIDEVFSPESSRFSTDGGPISAAGTSAMKNKIITTVNGANINDLAAANGGHESPAFLKIIATAFHDDNQVKFTIADRAGAPEIAITCKTDIFVGQHCREAQPQLRTSTGQQKMGEKYNPQQHSIYALHNPVNIVEAMHGRAATAH